MVDLIQTDYKRLLFTLFIQTLLLFTQNAIITQFIYSHP
jgi:hypothetical protein